MIGALGSGCDPTAAGPGPGGCDRDWTAGPRRTAATRAGSRRRARPPAAAPRRYWQGGSWATTEMGRSAVCTMGPLVARSVTVAVPTGALAATWSRKGVLVAPRRGTLTLAAVWLLTPWGRLSTSRFTVPAKSPMETTPMLFWS